jgi:hypothetical protein
VLYNFAGSSDGGDPYASLIRDGAGNLYSTFGYGGGTSFSGDAPECVHLRLRGPDV